MQLVNLILNAIRPLADLLSKSKWEAEEYKTCREGVERLTMQTCQGEAHWDIKSKTVRNLLTKRLLPAASSCMSLLHLIAPQTSLHYKWSSCRLSCCFVSVLIWGLRPIGYPRQGSILQEIGKCKITIPGNVGRDRDAKSRYRNAFWRVKEIY